MNTLKELCRELANDEISSVTVYDDMNGTEERFGWLEDVLDWYGEGREVHPIFTDREPDEEGHLEITLTDAA